MTTDTLGPLEQGILLVVNNEQERQQDVMRLVRASWKEFTEWKAEFEREIGYEPGIKQPIRFVANNLEYYVMDKLYDARDCVNDSLVMEIVGDVRTLINWEALAREFLEDYNDQE